MQQPVIHIQPVEVWTYYEEERLRLCEELVEIASNEDTKTSVYVTDEDNYPYLYVYRDDKKIFESKCYSQYMAERNLREIYAKYLTPLQVVGSSAPTELKEDDCQTSDDEDDVDLPPCTDLDAMSEAEFKDYCNEREDVILKAVCELIDVLTEDETGSIEFGDGDEDSIDVVVDKIVEYLAIKCGFSIRRPMEIMDEDSGLMVRTEYPYEEFEFGDGELSLK